MFVDEVSEKKFLSYIFSVLVLLSSFDLLHTLSWLSSHYEDS